MQYILISQESDLDKACSVSHLIAALVNEQSSCHRRWLHLLSHKNLVLYVVTNVTYWWQHLSLSISFLTGPVRAFFYLERDHDIFDTFLGSSDCANVQKEGKTKISHINTQRRKKGVRIFDDTPKGNLWSTLSIGFNVWVLTINFFNFIVFPKNLKIM